METKQNEIRNKEIKFKGYINNVLCWLVEHNHISSKKFFSTKLSTTEEDTKYSFDMLFGNTKISCRLRTNKWINMDDITIRSHCNGGRTEIDKITDGEGQLYFYGWLNKNETNISRWILFDVDPIRTLLFDNGHEFNNFDGTKLKAYSIKFLKENKSLIASYEKDEIKILLYKI